MAVGGNSLTAKLAMGDSAGMQKIERRLTDFNTFSNLKWLIFFATLTVKMSNFLDRVQLEMWDLVESEGTRDPLVHLESKVCLGLLEKRVER